MRAACRAYVRRFALWLLVWVDACPICGAPWTEHRCPYTPVLTVARFCEVCQVELPVDAIRTHHGKWRCAAHKGQD